MRLHRRLDRIAALTLPVLQHVDGISMGIATLKVEHVLADPPMRGGLQCLAHKVLLLIDQLADDLIDLMIALGIKEAR